MSVNRPYAFTFVIILSLLGVLSYHVIKPFLNAIAWAIVLGIVFYPLFLLVHRVVKWQIGASVITLVLVVLILAGPIAYIIILMGAEAKKTYAYLVNTNFQVITDLLSHKPVMWILNRFHALGDGSDLNVKDLIVDNLTRFWQKIIPELTLGIKNLLGILFDFFIVMFALFFFFLDGPDFIETIMEYMPFSETHKKRLQEKIKDMVISSIYGSVALCLSQGVISGLTYSILGLSAPVLLGAVTALSAFIPMGAAVMWGVVAIFLAITGSYVKAIVVVIVGIVALIVIDNVLVPIIVSGRTKVPVVMVFFTVVGGIEFFGLIGIIMGPLVFVLFMSMFEIFKGLENDTN
ncbi:AI-2E family transporter [Candidatus Magnetomonas plexicatena]|uniref:AI-2E family transporter n=1 Tax=Candidatus Magnetomonas plexicatena TaxID=2552947 RepID=UPI001103C8BE|nr:AI-2E family transporter [Nitrospirales bacterium LBB_01]